MHVFMDLLYPFYPIKSWGGRGAVGGEAGLDWSPVQHCSLVRIEQTSKL